MASSRAVAALLAVEEQLSATFDMEGLSVSGLSIVVIGCTEDFGVKDVVVVFVPSALAFPFNVDVEKLSKRFLHLQEAQYP